MPTPSFTISLDFELHWGIWDLATASECRATMLETRALIPKLLSLFSEHDVRATWATVGALFCENRQELEHHVGQTRPVGWLDRVGVGHDENADPLHFAPSLIQEIRSCAGQEIASHTFSHLECTEAVSEADAETDLRACRQVDESIESLVFPRNAYSPRFLRAAKAAGFSSYRSTPNVVYWKPNNNRKRDRAMRLLDSYLSVPHFGKETEEPGSSPAPSALRASRFLRPVTGWALANDLRDRLVRSEMEAAARAGASYHLWWHPHNLAAHPSLSFDRLNGLLVHFSSLRRQYGMQSKTMRDLVAAEGREATA